MSNLVPQNYDAKALAYIRENATEIRNISKALGVSELAVAGSVAREITRSDKENFSGKALHHVALGMDLLLTWESRYESKLQYDQDTLRHDPGAFDGSFGRWHQFLNPPLSDIGPGKIKILTAFQLIKQYKGSPEGKAAGLDHYRLDDLKKIVEDLHNPHSPLSIHIAALVILNGQKFFSGKSIAGIPWSKLSKGQKDAALTAYYTVGEHGVSVDIAKNEFFPFTTGSKGGEVGPWLIFGDNHKNLIKNLNGGISSKLPSVQAVTVAPIKRGKPAAKRSNSQKLHASSSSGGGAMRARGLIETLIGQMRNVRATKERNSPASAALMRYVDKDIALKRAASRVMDPIFNARSQAAGITPSAALMIERAAQDGRTSYGVHPGKAIYSWSPNANRRKLTSGESVANGYNNGLSANEMLTRVIAASRQETMPSIAPISGKVTYADNAVQRRPSRGENDETVSGEPSRVSRTSLGGSDEQVQFGRSLRAFFDQEARLPPSGGTGFDPRLSPAWPGLKLPA